MTDIKGAAPVKKPLTIQQINAHTVALQNKNNEYTSALHRMTEDLRKKLRAAFDNGEDVTKFVVAIMPSAEAATPIVAPEKPAKKAAKSK